MEKLDIILLSKTYFFVVFGLIILILILKIVDVIITTNKETSNIRKIKMEEEEYKANKRRIIQTELQKENINFIDDIMLEKNNNKVDNITENKKDGSYKSKGRRFK